VRELVVVGVGYKYSAGYPPLANRTQGIEERGNGCGGGERSSQPCVDQRSSQGVRCFHVEVKPRWEHKARLMPIKLARHTGAASQLS
jgi:hypothetical protein